MYIYKDVLASRPGLPSLGLRRAFRRLAAKTHPDVSGSADSFRRVVASLLDRVGFVQDLEKLWESNDVFEFANVFFIAQHSH